MKKKITTLIISSFLILNSFTTSFANPLVLTKIAEVSLIYSIGKLALNTVGFIGSIGDVIDLGGNIYNKMTDSEKTKYKDSVKFENDKFSYGEDSFDYISSYVPSSSQGFHLMPNIKRRYYPKVNYIPDEKSLDYVKTIFDSEKEVIEYQGTKYDFLFYKHDSGSYSNYCYLYYKLNSSSIDTLKRIGGKFDKDSDIYFYIYISSLRSEKGSLSCDWKYILKDSTTERNYSTHVLYSDIPNICDNCPHEFEDIKDSYEYPTKEELDYIEKNYPQYENDILVPGGSTGGGSTGGGSTGGGNNNNSPIISNPPSFPNLSDFDFSGLNIEALGDMFSNFTTKLPFSLPFDLFNLISGFSEEPIAPIFDVNLLGQTLVLDFTEFEELANLIRMFTLLGYVFGLIILTKKFGG